MKTAVHSGTLSITTPGSFSAVSPMQVAITVPYVDTLRLSGTGAMLATGSTPTVYATLDGTGALRLSGPVARDVTPRFRHGCDRGDCATRSLDAADSAARPTYTGFPSR